MAILAATAALAGGACGRDDSVEPAAGGPSLHLDTELIGSLQAFDECEDLLAYLRTEGAKVVGPFGFDGGGVVAYATDSREATAAAGAVAEGRAAAAPAAAASDVDAAPAADHSTTNVQEEGVDEPDLVKSDGKRLVTIAGGALRILDLTGSEPRVLATLRLDGPNAYAAGELLLAGDRVLVLRPVTPVYDAPPPGIAAGRGIAADAAIASVPPGGGGRIEPRTSVTVVDIAEPTAPKVVSTLTVDGDLVASRMVDGVARLVLRSGPPLLPFLFPSGSQESIAIAAEANRKAVAESTLDDWLPGFTQDGDDERRLTDCRDVRRPEVFSGVGMLSVVTVDAEDPRPGPAATVVGAGEIVYASAQHLYVTSTAWQAPTASTDVHEFDIHDRVRTTYVASGHVGGRLLNSFSMSEHDGALRVATTDDATQESAVTVLREKDGALAEIGRVGGLGKGERIYAVRFVADRGYVVTFRQTDPLHVLDLSDPTKPVVTGELHINGYSAYLHPVGDHRLLGVGQDATDQGRIQGTQVSLFDVSDPAAPKRLANAVLPQSRSEAEFDHHAFLWWAKTGLTVVPVQSFTDGASAAVGFTVGDADVRELGRVAHPDRSPVRRTLVVGDRVVTVSDSGVATSDLSTLRSRSWLAFTG